MFTQEYKRLIKVGKRWVDPFAVEAIRELTFSPDRSEVFLASGSVIQVQGDPDTVAKTLFKEGV